MSHLYFNSGTDYDLWSDGYAPFLPDYEHNTQIMYIAVSCRLGDLVDTIALLDTAAPWSIIDAETAKILSDQLGPSEYPTRFRSWRGPIEGKLHNLKITLIAQENCGFDLSLNGTVFVADNWSGPTVLGFHGFLERIRIALDPGLNQGQEIFYFGAIK